MNVSSIPAAIACVPFFLLLFLCACDQGFLVGPRRQYNPAPFGWEQDAKRDNIRVVSGM